MDSQHVQDGQADMEAWLDNNPGFFEEYFMKKAHRSMVDAWLTAHAKHTSSTDDEEEASCPENINLSLRRISTHDFATSAGGLHPMVRVHRTCLCRLHHSCHSFFPVFSLPIIWCNVAIATCQ